MNDNNEKKIPSPFGPSVELSARAVCVADWTFYQLNIQIKDYVGFYEIRDSDQNILVHSQFFFKNNQGDELLQTVRHLINYNLCRRALRLIDTDDEVTLLRKY